MPPILVLRSLVAGALILSGGPSFVGAQQRTTPAPGPGRYLVVDSALIYYEECGHGPALVLLHDGLVHSETWNAVWPTLCQRFHVVRYDRRGMGRSPAPTRPFVPTEDLAALLADRGIAMATLVGSSSGAGLAIDFAIRHPDQVDRLVLIGPVLHGMPSSAHFLQRGERNNSPLARGDARGAARNWANDRYQIAGQNRAARKALFDALADNPQNLRYHGEFDRHFLIPAVARIEEIRQPTLILVGESDIPDVQAYSGAIERGIWGASREVIPHAGHLIQLERPVLLCEKIVRFLDHTQTTDVPTTVLQTYAGDYRGLLDGQSGTIAFKDGRLFLHLSGEKDLPLFAASETKFFILVWGGIDFTFVRDSGGRVSAVEVAHAGKLSRADRADSSTKTPSSGPLRE